MSKMGRYIFEIQEKEKEALIHNEQQISEEEQHQIDQYEQENYDIKDMSDQTFKKTYPKNLH